jgi:hypothetical protein
VTGNEFPLGEVVYFQAQGFTDEQARDMAAAEYRRLVLQIGGSS